MAEYRYRNGTFPPTTLRSPSIPRTALTLFRIGATFARYREAAMKYRCFVVAAALICGLGTGQLFAQAAAESILTHGLSSTAGSSLGKTLGNAMGNAASQLGGRLGQQTSSGPSVQRPATKVKTGSIPAVATTAAPAPSGSLIASIQGGTGMSSSANCVAPAKPAAALQSNASPDPATGSGASAQGAIKPAPVPVSNCQPALDANSHPAVVNLPAPK